jgi:hypothetical protein
LFSLSSGGLLKGKAIACAISLKLRLDTPRIYGFLVDLRKNSDYFFLKEVGKSEAIS